MNRIEAKKNAKEILRNRPGRDAAIFLLILICLQTPGLVGLIKNLPNLMPSLSPGSSGIDAISGFLAQSALQSAVRAMFTALPLRLIGILLNLLFHGGLVRAALRLSDGDEDMRALDTVTAFDHLGKFILIALCEALLMIAWSLPAVGLAAGAALSVAIGAGGDSWRVGLAVAVLLLIASAVWSCWVSIVKPLQYFFAFHFCEDDPELGPMECIRESSRLTLGHKGEIFIAELSFLGWRLLEITFFARIYTIPYRYLTYAQLYRQLKGAASQDRDAREVLAGGSDALLTAAAVRQDPALEFLNGEYAGSRVGAAEGGEIRIGRDPGQAHVVISERCARISGLHCGVRYDSLSDGYIVTDYSANGTYTEGARLPAGSTRVRRGTVIKLADGEVLFRLI